METILGGTSTITSLVGDVFELMVSNPLLIVFLAGSLLTLGIGMFRKIKRSAK